MRLTVFGATGRTGTLLLRQALARGDTVTAVVRDPRTVALHDPKVSIAAIPDLDDVYAVQAALHGAEAVLSAIGPHHRRDAPVAAPTTRAIVAAMDKTAVRRVIVVSAAPVGTPPADEDVLNRIMTPVVTAFFRRVYEDLGSMERRLSTSGTAWTALRPAKLTDGPLTGRYRTRIGGSVAGGHLISRADLAHAMLASLARPETEQAVVGVAY